MITVAGFSGDPKDYDIRVENRKTGAGVRITADRPLARLVVWSVRPTRCPEPFINVRVEPGCGVHLADFLRVLLQRGTVTNAPKIGEISGKDLDLDLNINPDSQESPAMLNVIGHNQEAFRNKLYQIVISTAIERICLPNSRSRDRE